MIYDRIIKIEMRDARCDTHDMLLTMSIQSLRDQEVTTQKQEKSARCAGLYYGNAYQSIPDNRIC